MGQTLKALIVDDHALIAQGVAIALEGEGVEVRVTTGPSADDVLVEAKAMAPDVVLLDLQLGGDIGTSVPLIEPLRELGTQVLVLTGVTDRASLAECLEAGAIGLAAKSEPFHELVAKVVRAARGEATMPPHERFSMLDDLRTHRAETRTRMEPFERLTRREALVLRRLMDGVQADAIAAESYVSVATIRSQIRSILQKLEVNSQLAAVAIARDAGWEPDASMVVSA